MASLIERNGTYYLQWYVGKKIKRRSLRTTSLQIAKDKARQFESAQLRGTDNPLPTRTPIPTIVTDYVRHIRTIKTPKSAQTDIYYLRDSFGPICEALTVTSRKTTAKKKPAKQGGKAKRRPHVIEASHFEAITTSQVSDFIGAQVRSRGLAPKTANRYREILHRLFNWAMRERGVRIPGGVNPVKNVERYKERAPEIRYLTLAQIDEQLHVLRFKPQLQTMVAFLIYAGVRREELLWLTVDDVNFKAGAHGMIQIRAKTIGGESWQPKTKRNRAVPISSTLRNYLDRYVVRGSDRGWYFPSPEGVRWDGDNFSADLRTANSEATLAWTALDYRHTFGSQLAQKGTSLYKIATLMGNSPAICRKHYAAIVPEATIIEVEFRAPYMLNENLPESAR